MSFNPCEHTWRTVCIIDGPLRGSRGWLSEITEPVHEGSMEDHYLVLAEQWLRSMADAVAAKRQQVLVRRREAA
jgi:hypothetical protein